MTKLRPAELGIVAVCSAQYAIGRPTYVVEEVCSFIGSHIDKLSTHVISMLIKDIESPLLDCECSINKEIWMNLLSKLKNEMNKRKSL